MEGARLTPKFAHGSSSGTLPGRGLLISQTFRGRLNYLLRRTTRVSLSNGRGGRDDEGGGMEGVGRGREEGEGGDLL